MRSICLHNTYTHTDGQYQTRERRNDEIFFFFCGRVRAHRSLCYTSNNGLRWHRDTDPNDGDNREPIVSISLGNTCTFGYKKYGHSKQYVDVRSGDVLIWGGPERNLLHCIERVTPASVPRSLRNVVGDARLNFTFRAAPNILGYERQYTSKQYLSTSHSLIFFFFDAPRILRSLQVSTRLYFLCTRLQPHVDGDVLRKRIGFFFDIWPGRSHVRGMSTRFFLSYSRV
jgi:hypothetical protein